MEFQQISESKVTENDALWRYIDFNKLIDLAINQELHFTRLDQFPDPFEGVTYNLIAERFFAKYSNITNPSIDKNIRDEHNRNNEKVQKEYEDESHDTQRTQYTNCWFKSNRESIAMWNLYSNRDSIALKVNAQNLIDYFKRNLQLQPLAFYPKYKFICGEISYLRLNPFDSFEDPKLPIYNAFKKDVAYDFEKEYRFLIVTPTSESNSNPKFFKYTISNDFIKLIKIVCHPEMENWKYNNLKKLCKKIGLPKPAKSEIEMR